MGTSSLELEESHGGGGRMMRMNGMLAVVERLIQLNDSKTLFDTAGWIFVTAAIIAGGVLLWCLFKIHDKKYGEKKK